MERTLLSCKKFSGTYEDFSGGVIDSLMSEDTESELLARHDPEIVYTALSILSSIRRGLVHSWLSREEVCKAVLSVDAMPSRRAVLWALCRAKFFTGETGVLRAMMPGSCPTIREILSCSAEMSGATLEKIRSRSRDIDISDSRMRAEWIARNAFDASLAQVSEIMGRNHTTVLASIGRVDIMIRRSPGIIIPIFEQANTIDRLAQIRRAESIAACPGSEESEGA